MHTLVLVPLFIEGVIGSLRTVNGFLLAIGRKINNGEQW